MAALLLLAGLAGFFAFAHLVDQANADAAHRSESPAQGVVVLTGGGHRIAEAFELIEGRNGQRLLISGVNERTGHDDVLRLYPGAKPLMACCVDLGAQARNTIGNAIEARRWARRHGFTRLTLVTSPYHMPRALMELRHAMPDVVIAPHSSRADASMPGQQWRDPDMLRVLLLEYVKFGLSALRTRLETDPETSRLAIIMGGRKPVSPKQVKGAVAG